MSPCAGSIVMFVAEYATMAEGLAVGRTWHSRLMVPARYFEL